MSDKYFIDSNLFLYVHDPDDEAKSAAAANWLRCLALAKSGLSNLQVMNEVSNVLLKQSRLRDEEVFVIIDGFSTFGREPIGSETVAAARMIRLETSYSWWDCLLLASAIELGCRTFLSEDMKDGHQVRGLTILDPFRHSPPAKAH